MESFVFSGFFLGSLRIEMDGDESYLARKRGIWTRKRGRNFVSRGIGASIGESTTTRHQKDDAAVYISFHESFRLSCVEMTTICGTLAGSGHGSYKVEMLE
jgi:hypothetical protein